MRIERTCKQCGCAFTPKEANRITFCSRECAFAWKRENAKYEWSHLWFKDCTVCGVRFVTRARAQVVCSAECSAKKARDYSRRLNEAKSERNGRRAVCRQCGVEFVMAYGDKRRTFCSDRCAKRFARRTLGSKNARGRAKRAGVPYKPVSKALIIKTHGKRCWICGERIDFSVEAPHPKSFSVDHVVPLACGGWHDLPNLKPAHFECNSKRGAEYSGQLMLCYQ